jgi:arsenite methyltransferase
MIPQDKDERKSSVRHHYGAIAARDSEACGCGPSSCCGGEAEPAQALPDQDAERLGYTQEDVNSVPQGTNLGLGCGNPIGIASLQPGEIVLDLGSGAGFDCFLAAKQVGGSGRVIGVDMTPQMTEKAQANAIRGQYSNVEFRLGEIEHLPVPDGTVDVIISNCVINLSPDKTAVFKEAFRVLKPGGRLAITDIVATAPLPESIKRNDALYCSCIGGAATIDDLRQMLAYAGFEKILITPKDESRELIRAWTPGMKIDELVVSAYLQAVRPLEGGERKPGGSREYFDELAQQWDSMRSAFFSHTVREKALAAAEAKAGLIAADLGAGSGFITEELLRHGLRVVAVDQSERMLETMRQKFGTGAAVEYRTGESEHLPLENESVDYAFANMYLHHVAQPPEAIREMVRILKRDGKLVITDLDEHGFDFLRTEQHDRWMGFKREDIHRWFVEAGLKNVSVNCVGDNCCVTSSTGAERAAVSIFLAIGSK